MGTDGRGDCGNGRIGCEDGRYKASENAQLLSERSAPVNARKIASALRKNVHADTVDLLSVWLKEETATYPDRSYGAETDRQIQTMLQQAEDKRMELERKGIRAEVLREEPFTTAQDHLDFQVYLMVWKRGLFDRTVTVECIGRKAHVEN